MRTLLTRSMVFGTFAIGLLIAGCSGDNPPIDPTEIRLKGALQNSENVNVRGDGPIKGELPANPLSLAIYRADEPYGQAYTSAPGGTMRTSGAIEFLSPQFYLTNEGKSTLIGLYPSVGEYAPDDRTVTFSAPNGSTDIMACNLVEGSRCEPIEDEMLFEHLLTRVQVEVKSTDADVAAVWGKITGITIAGKKVGCVVTLPDPSTGGKPEIAATDEAAEALTVIAVNSDPLALTEKFVSYGYAMFLPGTTSESLTLNVTTEKGGTKVLTVPERTLKAGHAYKIEMIFKAVDVSVTASLTDWIDDEDPIEGELE